MLSPTSYILPILLATSTLLSTTTAQFNGNFGQTTTSSTSTRTSSTSRTATSTTAAATATSTCLANCETTYPIVNHCNGTETGSALDQCKCRSYTPLNDPLISCILGCPSDQQYSFANSIPKLCAQTLFLGLNLSTTAKPYAINSAPAATVQNAQATPTGNDAAARALGSSALGLGTLALGVVIFL